MQLSQPVQLPFEDLDGHFLLLVRIFLHLDVHALPGLRAGQRFHLRDLPVDGVTNLLKMEVFCFRGRMVRQSC